MVSSPRETEATGSDERSREDPLATCVVVRATIAAERFVLDETLRAVRTAEFEAERIVESGGETTLPLLWAFGAPQEELTAALDADPDVVTASPVASFEDRRLYRVEWEADVRHLLRMLTHGRATMLDLTGGDRRWTFRLISPSRAAFATTKAFCEAHNLPFRVESIREFEGVPAGRYGLTPEQYEVLSAACECGYFRVPRECTLDELGERLDLSHQAVSERLRRGHRTLVRNALLDRSRGGSVG